MPITATRLPARSTSWFHCAEWKISPWKPSMPAMSGIFGSDKPPAPTMRLRADQVPAVVLTVQRCAASSQAASVTLVSKTKRSRVPDLSATFLM